MIAKRLCYLSLIIVLNWLTSCQQELYKYNIPEKSTEEPLFLGMQGPSFDNKTVHRGFEGSNFSSNVNVLVSAYNHNDYPVIIENKVGNGKLEKRRGTP